MLVNQIALSGRAELADVSRWYVEGLGLLDAGEASFAGPEIAQLQGIDLPTVALDMRWVIDRNDFMQLELFSYTEPAPRPRGEDWAPDVVGYNVVMVHVLDFDATLTQLAALGTHPTTDPTGAPGGRHACVADPNGLLVEIMEDDLAASTAVVVRPDIPAAVRGVRVTVPDLEQARSFFVDAIGLRLTDPLHTPEHEALWGLAGSAPKILALTDGRSVVELAHYPHTRPRPEGYRICDEGILNIALGSTEKEPYLRTRSRVGERGHTLHSELILNSDVEVTYVTDAQGIFNVELMFMGTAAHASFGFLEPADSP
jgi:catechol 2,3-dioxygenase-like lactoylglutathione lyase family enzyme